jgi:hypothetical protein
MFPKKSKSFMIHLSITERENNDRKKYILRIVRQKEEAVALKCTRTNLYFQEIYENQFFIADCANFCSHKYK